MVDAMLEAADPVDVPDGRTGWSTWSAPAGTAATRSTCRPWPASSWPAPACPVCKHGNRAATSTSGAADLLEALGVAIDLDGRGVARCVDEAGIGFCFARAFHPALRHAGAARGELGIPTAFNFLGPLANPARVRRQVVGVRRPAHGRAHVGVLRRARRHRR